MAVFFAIFFKKEVKKYMKKIFFLFAIVFALALFVSPVMAAKPGDCTTIQSGTLVASDGSPISTGYDQWGYNYQALMFNGGYCDSYRNASWCQPYKDVNLIMKWNDAWISNKDCDNDGLLDRHYGFPSYIGSGAWLTNHQSGEYELDGKICKWNYFTKIVAVPADAVLVGGTWYTVEGAEIGPSIWGEFATTQEVSNDQCDPTFKYSFHGSNPGLGIYKP